MKALAKVLAIFVFTIFCLYGCSLIINTGTEVKVSDVPLGINDLNSGEIFTVAESKKIRQNNLKINFSTQEKNISKSTAIVAGLFNDEIKLLDFFVPGQNENPSLTFESTARSLVFMNPIFLGLSLEDRRFIFDKIGKDKDFQKLVILVSASPTLLDDKILELSNKIAINIAISTTSVTNSESSQTTVNSEEVSNPFNNLDFPKQSCGDPLPLNEIDYPVSVYPVYIEYSESNLEKVKSQFCMDAYQLIREKTNKKSIQVGSLISIERAEAFKNFMIKNFGSGDIGEPTLIEELPPSKNSKKIEKSKIIAFNIVDKFLNFLISPVNAQQNPLKQFEFKIIQDFDNDGKFLNWPFWHGLRLELTQNSNGIQVKGSSLIAQQIVVIPVEKLFWNRHLTVNDYSGTRNKEADIVAETLIKPVDLDLIGADYQPSLLKTIVGSNEVTIPLNLKSGKQWKAGEYLAVLSGGIYFDRPDKDLFGVFSYNVALQLYDIFNLIGISNVRPAQIMSTLGVVFTDCKIELNNKLQASKDTSKTDFDYLKNIHQCLQKPNNMLVISQLLASVSSGQTPEKINEKDKTELAKKLEKLFQIETGLAEKLEKTFKTQQKLFKNGFERGLKTINLIDKGVSVGRSGFLGLYLSRERDNFYNARFTIEDLTEFKEIEIDCEAAPPAKFHDLEFNGCYSGFFSFEIGVKNYSSNWYEVERKHENVLVSTLIFPGEAVKLPFQYLKSYHDRFTAARVYRDPNANRIKREKIKTNVKRYFQIPSREVTVSCDAPIQEIWGITMTPKCTASGTYIDLSGTNQRTIKIDLLNGNSINLVPEAWINTSGHITSNGREVKFVMSFN